MKALLYLKKIYGKFLEVGNRHINRVIGNINYKKFVIISDARTGSTLLMGLLNSHPEIIAEGEIFKRLRNINSIELWNDVFRSRPKKIRWVGFKLFYDHPWNSDDRTVWNLIEEDKDIVIIHLVRENILRSYISKQIGLKTKKWTENKKKPNTLTVDQKRVKINIEDCIANLSQIDQKERETREKYKNHKLIPVSYEELSNDKSKVMRCIFNELEVKNKILSTSMLKQNPEKLRDLIVNYEELYSALEDTRWISFLDEEIK